MLEEIRHHFTDSCIGFIGCDYFNMVKYRGGITSICTKVQWRLEYMGQCGFINLEQLCAPGFPSSINVLSSYLYNMLNVISWTALHSYSFLFIGCMGSALPRNDHPLVMYEVFLKTYLCLNSADTMSLDWDTKEEIYLPSKLGEWERYQCHSFKWVTSIKSWKCTFEQQFGFLL